MSALHVAQADEHMVSLRDVTKSYGSFVALERTNLEVKKGEFLTLLGPSGSGKTTLLNVISGMQAPSAGRIFIDGRDVTTVPASKRGIGMVFQSYALMPHMTVFENIAFPLQIRHIPKTEIKVRVDAVLALVGLAGMGQRKPKELSGGQQQRVSIARCLVYDPSLILMDEPLGALDKKLREQMQIEIKRLHIESGITIMYVTHDQEEALNMSDRIMLMKGGRIEQLGTPQELYSTPASQFAADFIGESSFLDAEVIVSGASGQLRLTSSEICHLCDIDEPVGANGKLLLRPESLRIVADGRFEPGHNRLKGKIRDTLISGSTTKHFVLLDNGHLVTVQELSDSAINRYAKDQTVEVTWPAKTGRFLSR
jgi:putative spermidine/putrescine transport system ATP-binding protein